jgi:hypothetical protein
VTDVFPLAEKADPKGRNEHTLIVDEIVQKWFSEGLDDSKIYFVEKEYPYTSGNVALENAHRVGDIRGDLDIVKYDLEEDELYVREIKGRTDIPADMSDEERRQQFEDIDNAHDQLAELKEAVEVIELQEDVDIALDTGVWVWSDVFESTSYNSETLPCYTRHGDHLHTDEAYELARDSYTFEVLNENLFDGDILEKRHRIMER